MEINDQDENQESDAGEYVTEGEDLLVDQIITALIEGQPLFRCRGMVRVKVGGKAIQLPIRSVDVEESIRLLANKRPSPPLERVFIKREEAKKSGGQSGWVTVANENAPSYLEAQRAYTTELNYLIMLKGLDLVTKDSTGKVVWDPNDESQQDKDAAIRVLRGLGMTGWQFSDIVEAIQNLTKWEEEALEKNSGGD